jgi:hypothetical protein
MQCNFFKRAYKEKLENEQSDDEAVPNQGPSSDEATNREGIVD